MYSTMKEQEQSSHLLLVLCHRLQVGPLVIGHLDDAIKPGQLGVLGLAELQGGEERIPQPHLVNKPLRGRVNNLSILRHENIVLSLNHLRWRN